MLILVIPAYFVVVIFSVITYINDYINGYFEKNSYSTAELVVLFMFGCIFWPIGVMYCIYYNVNDMRIIKKMRKKKKHTSKNNIIETWFKQF